MPRCRFVLVAVVHSLAFPARSPAEARPNIIVVFADDLGWSDIGCYGGEIPTPNIDGLAKTGIRFTQFYNNAVCGPSRISLLTGLYCQRIGHGGRAWNDPTDFRHCATVADFLHSAGYFTLMVGKWQQRQLPARHGFDRFFGPMCQAKISYFDEVKSNPFYLNEKRYPLPKDFYLIDAFNDHAVQFVEEATRKKDRPFFLYLAHIAPHWPLHARDADIAPHRERYRKHGWDHWRSYRFDRQRDMKLISPDWKLSPRPKSVHAWEADPFKDWQAERMAVYAAQVTAIDQGVGRILETIRKAGVADNTLVMFLSDNGGAPDGGVAPTTTGFGFPPKQPGDWRLDGMPIRPGSGPKNMPGPRDTFAGYGLGWSTLSNTPWKGTKLTAYEGGIRTPLVVSWPAVIRQGDRITNDIGHVIDLAPTFLELAQVKYPATFQGRKLLPLDGKSLVPILHGKPRQGHEILAWRVPQHDALHRGKWALVRGVKNPTWELYDLVADGTQTTNLAASNPDIVRDLANHWQQWATSCGVR